MDTTQIISIEGHQAVKLPEEYRFTGATVSIRKEGEAVILEPIRAATELKHQETTPVDLPQMRHAVVFCVTENEKQTLLSEELSRYLMDEAERRQTTPAVIYHEEREWQAKNAAITPSRTKLKRLAELAARDELPG